MVQKKTESQKKQKLTSLLSYLENCPNILKEAKLSSQKSCNDSLEVFWVFGSSYRRELLTKIKEVDQLFVWQKKSLSNQDLSSFCCDGELGRQRFIFLELTVPPVSPEVSSLYGVARDRVGAVFAGFCQNVLSLKTGPREVHVIFIECQAEEKQGALIGMGLAAYSSQKLTTGAGEQKAIFPPRLTVAHADKDELKQAQILAEALHLTRTLTNLPAGHLNPKSFSDLALELLGGQPGTEVEVWDAKKLEKERFGMHLAVGRAAHHPPCLVRIIHKGAKDRAKEKTRGFLGKGVTFDSGGLDIKSASGMRNMKKDMTGAAVVFGLAYWAQKSGFPMPCEFILGLAENAVSADAFRPGDIVQSRNGLTVEVGNTDAEGRLVLGDSLAFLAERADSFSSVINVATLTGAMKVALGTETFGFFANDEPLAEALSSSSEKAGEPAWRLPLYSPMMANLKSSVADLNNISNQPFGGPITAALFLSRFAQKLKWAHLDIYGWKDAPREAYAEAGGSAQSLQALVALLTDSLRKDK